MKTITIELTDLEWKAMADVVPDPEAWIIAATNGKKTKCIKMVIAKEQTRLMNSDQETMPATVDGMLESHFGQEGYKNRAERDAASEAAMLADMEAE